MSDAALRLFALAGLLFVVVAGISVLASWAWRARRASHPGSTPRTYAGGPPSGSADVPPPTVPAADEEEDRPPPADPSTYASMPSGLPGASRPADGAARPGRPSGLPAAPPPASQEEVAYQAAHRQPGHEAPSPEPRSLAYGRHHAPDPPPREWPPHPS